ncbi:Gfo/Idh/MocA family oxidoreductase [Aquihabitans sp. G128]|uniref:Gfo/Idh/MocA family protein n=1 Tax=Aquihabitans sp. G128 TaxID=2849779 RepID=UPI001C233594|nr:Gfo/Idh/MocA family oxidoreductase [Aquihabitans sp. G128]QXC61591.1 Gfo/Idh/MocA family oxidoreductase [Aquihabitans sp. G128]
MTGRSAERLGAGTGTWRWGIAGTGGIATSFTEDLARVEGAEVVAVGSRTQAGAHAFAARHGIARAHGSYEALAEDPDVDVLYVATPHPDHHAQALRALAAGKHVVCEKPLALNAAQAAEVVAAADAADRFLLEAVWSRFLPAYDVLRQVLADGEVGQPQQVDADFGYVMAFDPGHRLFDPALGGGATLDQGIYPVQLGHLVLGPPDAVVATGHVGATGVDEHVVAGLRHPGGGLTVAKASLRASLACEARISGTLGAIELPAFMHCPQAITVSSPAGRRTIEAPMRGHGLCHEAAEVQRCLQAGERQSPQHPWADTLAIAATLDAVRAALGVRYPGE